MTPQEISDYKQDWLAKEPYSVVVNSDHDVRGKDWCRKNLERHQWSFQSWTSQSEHSFFFERAVDVQKFKNYIVS